jgi:hypothetical protein
MQSINQAVVLWEYASRRVGVDRCEGALSGFFTSAQRRSVDKVKQEKS